MPEADKAPATSNNDWGNARGTRRNSVGSNNQWWKKNNGNGNGAPYIGPQKHQYCKNYQNGTCRFNETTCPRAHTRHVYNEARAAQNNRWSKNQ